MKTFSTAVALAEATLFTGQFVETFGLTAAGDGGAARYYIISPITPEAKDIVLANGNIAKWRMYLSGNASEIIATNNVNLLSATTVQAQLNEIVAKVKNGTLIDTKTLIPYRNNYSSFNLINDVTIPNYAVVHTIEVSVANVTALSGGNRIIVPAAAGVFDYQFTKMRLSGNVIAKFSNNTGTAIDVNFVFSFLKNSNFDCWYPQPTGGSPKITVPANTVVEYPFSFISPWFSVLPADYFQLLTFANASAVSIQLMRHNWGPGYSNLVGTTSISTEFM